MSIKDNIEKGKEWEMRIHVYGTCSDECPMLTAKCEIDFELEIDKFERNHANDCTSLSPVTFLNVLIILIKFSVR